jgi:signal transduction histidine kinase
MPDQAVPRGRYSATMVGLVIAIFLMQFVSSAAAIFLLRAEILAVIRANREQQVVDLRDDLLASYYDGGIERLAALVRGQRGAAADPAVFISLEAGGRLWLSNIARPPNLAPSPRPQQLVWHGHRGAVLEAMALSTVLPDGSHLVVGVVGQGERRFNRAFAAAAGLTLAIAVGMGLFSALLLGAVISRRTHEIASAAAELASGNFGARLDVGRAGDGFDHLRRQMNRMAERIGELVRQLGTVSGALAHDLRSPVARLSAAIEAAQRQVSGPPQALDALAAARIDAERLRSMLETALEIGRLESGQVADRRQPLDLAQVAADLVELYEPLAEQQGRVIVARLQPVEVRADRELLSRAIANLIDNALHYGGRTITVATRADGDQAEVAVEDDGPGIAAADRARVVERFVRLDQARTTPGAGLGLAMVAAVARLHGGDLVFSGTRGLIAALRLPR